MNRFSAGAVWSFLLTAALLVVGCGGSNGSGGTEIPDDPSSYTPDAFNYTSPHSADHQPLRETVTALLADKEVASLDPGGTYWVAGDFDTGRLVWDSDLPWHDGMAEGFPFEHAASGQIDQDPEEDVLAAGFAPGPGGGPGSVRVASLERDGTWFVQFSLDVGTSAPRAFAVGDVDGDGMDESVFAWDDAQGLWISVVDDGQLTREFAVLVNYDDLDLEHIELELADVDADGRDEIVLLGTRGPYWRDERVPVLEVRDDASAAFGLLTQYPVAVFDHVSLNGGNAARLVTGDFDRFHPGEEICVTRFVFSEWVTGRGLRSNFQYESFAFFPESNQLRRWRRGAADDGDPNLVVLTPLGQPIWATPGDDLIGFDVVAGDLDGDGSDELVTTWFGVGTGGSADCPSSAGNYLAFTLPLDLTTQEIQDRWAVPDTPPAYLPAEFPAVMDAHNNSERVGAYVVLAEVHPPIPNTPSTSACPSSEWPDLKASQWSLVTADQDADMREELHVSGWNARQARWDPPEFVLPNFWSVVEAEARGDGAYALAQGWWNRHAELLDPQRLVAADSDGDDVRVRHTGNMELALADPIPLVLMAAPPCKAGIAQNYAGSETRFEHREGVGNTTSVTNGVTAGVWAGYGVSDPLGIFSASGKAKFNTEFARTSTETSRVTTCAGYTTGHGQDAVVFQGTLVESYEYEVVGAPDYEVVQGDGSTVVVNDVGKFMTIDVPVATKVYHWALDDYNDTVDPEHVIDPAILGHTIGDPAGYLSPAEATALKERYRGEMTDPDTGMMAVSQGAGSNDIAIWEEEVVGDAARATWSVSAEGEWKAGGARGGFSVGITQTHAYEVSVQNITICRGTVGAIASADYPQWHYDYGLLTYTRTPDADDLAAGVFPYNVPFQIETYFTDPTGWGY